MGFELKISGCQKQCPLSAMQQPMSSYSYPRYFKKRIAFKHKFSYSNYFGNVMSWAQ